MYFSFQKKNYPGLLQKKIITDTWNIFCVCTLLTGLRNEVSFMVDISYAKSH